MHTKLQTLRITKNRKTPTGLSLDNELFERIEKAIGYEPRSHYISRLLNASIPKVKENEGSTN
jgi:metal-responsive CopG/Arc/MetJ family transcriptional regulator